MKRSLFSDQGHVAIGSHRSSRHQIAFHDIPRNQGKPIYTVWDYAAILDSVYEMTEDIYNGNPISPRAAILQALKVEHWTVKPEHIDEIARRLA